MSNKRYKSHRHGDDALVQIDQYEGNAPSRRKTREEEEEEGEQVRPQRRRPKRKDIEEGGASSSKERRRDEVYSDEESVPLPVLFLLLLIGLVFIGGCRAAQRP